MNVTLIANGDEKGKVKVSISGNDTDSDEFSALGDVSVELKVTGDALKGYVFAGKDMAMNF